MNLQARKIAIIQEIVYLQNEEILSELENLLHKRNAGSQKEERRPMSIDEINKEIDQALDDGTDESIIPKQD